MSRREVRIIGLAIVTALFLLAFVVLLVTEPSGATLLIPPVEYTPRP